MKHCIVEFSYLRQNKHVRLILLTTAVTLLFLQATTVLFSLHT